MNINKKSKRDSLLKLLGADPMEEVPTFSEALDMCQPMDRQQIMVCKYSGKNSYSSESAAKTAANRRLKKGSNTGKLRCYLCPDCNMWHMSSSFHR